MYTMRENLLPLIFLALTAIAHRSLLTTHCSLLIAESGSGFQPVVFADTCYPETSSSVTKSIVIEIKRDSIAMAAVRVEELV